ncbi:DegT/DnrJ/EryC1/StrS family aminotransferase [Clostridium subterminale]|uniref:DegT/DnrJ/EryC1/StrS family aminotransferase n=1 Tax=Clostridium subterminale TaxID=1550 RepID=A0ABP3W138_CLOSU
MNRLAINGGNSVIGKLGAMKNKYGSEELNAVQKVLERGALSSFRGGTEVREFQDLFSKYVSVENSIATTSGTTALHTSLAALNLPIGSEVAVPALTFVSTASVVLQEGLKPVFIDVDEFYCMDPVDLEKKISQKTKAVIPVHLYGHPANMVEIVRIARENNLYIIEDACQAHGATINDKKVGGIGDIGCFSFFETKNMSCGEGGMITIRNSDLFDSVCLVHEHGSPRSSSTWYSYERLGYNYNMTELQGAIGKVQLKKLDGNNEIRRKNAEYYINNLSKLNLVLPKEAENVKSVYHNFPVLLPEEFSKDRDFFVEALKAEGVPVDIAYPKPLYDTVLFKKLGYNDYLPVTENVTSRLFTLFTDNSMDINLINDISTAIEKVYGYLKNRK